MTGIALSAALLEWSERTGLGVPNATPGVVFSAEEDVAPDVIWISNERLERGLAADGTLHLAPELVVEILSPGATNERRDRELKLKLYARPGVDEYWIVDWRARTIDRFRRVGEQLQPVGTLKEADILSSPLLPGFAYPLEKLWRVGPR